MTLNLPARGAFSDMSHMWDPHKLGNVMWARIASGEMVPLDLHNRVSMEDAQTLNAVFGRLKAFRKIRPALEVLKRQPLQDSVTIKPYLIQTMVVRAEARELIASGDWDAIWSIL